MEQSNEQKYLLGNIYWAHDESNKFLAGFIFNRDFTKIKNVFTGEILPVTGEEFEKIIDNIKKYFEEKYDVQDIIVESSVDMYLNYLANTSELSLVFQSIPDNKFYKTRKSEDKPTKETIIACNNILVDKTDLLSFRKQLKMAYKITEIEIKKIPFQEFKKIVEDSHEF